MHRKAGHDLRYCMIEFILLAYLRHRTQVFGFVAQLVAAIGS